MTMQRPSVTVGRPLCILAVALLWSSAASGQPSAAGDRLFKEANLLYQTQRYAEAAAKYEEVVAANPALADAYFFLANSYDNLYRATKRGDPENDALLDRAIEHYRTRAGMNGGDPKIKRLASEYLVSAYGPDKKNDPAGQEPILLEMIADNPQDLAAYFGLATIYEQSGARRCVACASSPPRSTRSWCGCPVVRRCSAPARANPSPRR
jgi:tetratricopeptide (TPR) repeat protein